MTTTLSKQYANLTAFQQQILTTLANEGGTPEGDDAPYGLRIKRTLEAKRGEEVNHGRLYPNLDQLADMGFVTKFEIDKRTNGYRLTEDGVQVFLAHIDEEIEPALEAIEGETFAPKA